MAKKFKRGDRVKFKKDWGFKPNERAVITSYNSTTKFYNLVMTHGQRSGHKDHARAAWMMRVF